MGQEAQPGKVICFSSSAAYPITLQRPDAYRLLVEADIQFDGVLGQPDMSYGWSKLTHEYLAKLALKIMESNLSFTGHFPVMVKTKMRLIPSPAFASGLSIMMAQKTFQYGKWSPNA